jgi:fatty acid desaturase
MERIPSNASSDIAGRLGTAGAAVAFQAFREELAALGFFRRKPVRSFLELALFVIVTVAGVAILLSTANLVLEAVAMLLITLASLGVSTLAHTASHNAVSNKPWVNKALTYFGYPFFLQMSATYWRHKHLVIHHPHPNVAGVDDDIDLLPFFALTQDELAQAGAWRRPLYKYQVAYLPLALVGNAFNVIRSGWVFLIARLLDRQARRREHWIDFGALLLHYGVWVALPMLFLPAIHVIAFNLIRFALMSYGMYALFAPAHFPAEAAMVRPGFCGDAVEMQTLTTVNYRTGWLGRLICGGLEYQIEHHLLPSISPAHYPRLSCMVRTYCERHGYAYRSFGWPEALWKSLCAFARPKAVHAPAPYGGDDRADALS